jgi:diguanylate cyclase (GGDEF)-like protein
LLLRAQLAGVSPGPAWIHAELNAHSMVYLYLLLSMLAIALAFGWTVGGAMDRLAAFCLTDPLTALANRRHVEERLRREVTHAARNGMPLALLFMDVDRFKEINDRLGHAAGDRVLARVAAILRRCCRASDLAGRWGGDEFVLIAPLTGRHQAMSVGERIRAAMAGESGVTLSIGVADLGQAGGTSAERLYTCADLALRHAKDRGRNCVVLAAEPRAWEGRDTTPTREPTQRVGESAEV